MLMKKFVLVLAGTILIIAGVLLAQEEAMEIIDAEYFSYGAIKVVSPRQITINEYNGSTGFYEDLLYEVDPQVKVTNIDALTKIQMGQWVDIVYRIRATKKVVVSLTLNDELSSIGLPDPALQSGVK